MIVDALLELVSLLLDGLLFVLPSVTLPFETELQSVAGTVNGYMHQFNGILPMADLLIFYRWVATVWVPGYVAYVAFRWIWAHIPVLGSG